jgi:hypothetical protein
VLRSESVKNRRKISMASTLCKPRMDEGRRLWASWGEAQGVIGEKATTLEGPALVEGPASAAGGGGE